MEQDHEHHGDMTPWGNGHNMNDVCERCDLGEVVEKYMGMLVCADCYEDIVEAQRIENANERQAEYAIGFRDGAEGSLVRHPNVYVRLVGEDGNAYSILARVKQAMVRKGIPKQDVQAFLRDATSGDYDHLLRVVCDTVHVDWDMPRNDEDDEDHVASGKRCGYCDELHEDCECCDPEQFYEDEEA